MAQIKTNTFYFQLAASLCLLQQEKARTNDKKVKRRIEKNECSSNSSSSLQHIAHHINQARIKLRLLINENPQTTSNFTFYTHFNGNIILSWRAMHTKGRRQAGELVYVRVQNHRRHAVTVVILCRCCYREKKIYFFRSFFEELRDVVDGYHSSYKAALERREKKTANAHFFEFDRVVHIFQFHIFHRNTRSHLQSMCGRL